QGNAAAASFMGTQRSRSRFTMAVAVLAGSFAFAAPETARVTITMREQSTRGDTKTSDMATTVCTTYNTGSPQAARKIRILLRRAYFRTRHTPGTCQRAHQVRAVRRVDDPAGLHRRAARSVLSAVRQSQVCAHRS